MAFALAPERRRVKETSYTHGDNKLVDFVLKSQVGAFTNNRNLFISFRTFLMSEADEKHQNDQNVIASSDARTCSLLSTLIASDHMIGLYMANISREKGIKYPIIGRHGRTPRDGCGFWGVLSEIAYEKSR